MTKFIISYKLFFMIIALVVFSLAGFGVWKIFLQINIGTFEELSADFEGPEQYTELGNKFEGVGQFKEAEKAYLKALDMDPKLQLAAYVGLDRLYKDKISDKEDELAHIYLRGIALNPKSRALMRGLAQLYERMEKYEQAFQWYNMVIQYYPADRDSQAAIGRVQRKLSK